MGKNLFVKCPECGAENRIEEDYFEGNAGAHMACSFCRKWFYCHVSKKRWANFDEAVAYTKADEA